MRSWWLNVNHRWRAHAPQRASVGLYGPFLIVVGGMFIAMSMQLKPAGMMNQRDIGPQVVPMLLALAMFTAGIGHTSANLLRKQNEPKSSPIGDSASQGATFPGQALIVVTAMIVWALVMPHIGFVVSGLWFGVLMLLLMQAKLIPSLVAAAVMIPVAHVLFVEVFHVVLPMGPWGF